MKNTFDKGLECLFNLEKNLSKETPENEAFLRPLLLQYRAYGFICTGKHKEALNDLLICKDQLGIRFENPSSYNLLVCEGLLEITEHLNLEKGIQKLLAASQILKHKMQPYLYIALGLIHNFVKAKTADLAGDLENKQT